MAIVLLIDGLGKAPRLVCISLLDALLQQRIAFCNRKSSMTDENETSWLPVPNIASFIENTGSDKLPGHFEANRFHLELRLNQLQLHRQQPQPWCSLLWSRLEIVGEAFVYVSILQSIMQSVMCSKSRLNAEAIQFGRSALLLASDIGYAVKHVYPCVMVYIDDVCVIGWTFYSARCSMKKDTEFPRVIHRRV